MERNIESSVTSPSGNCTTCKSITPRIEHSQPPRFVGAKGSHSMHNEVSCARGGKCAAAQGLPIIAVMTTTTGRRNGPLTAETAKQTISRDDPLMSILIKQIVS